MVRVFEWYVCLFSHRGSSYGVKHSRAPERGKRKKKTKRLRMNVHPYTPCEEKKKNIHGSCLVNAGIGNSRGLSNPRAFH